MCTWDAANVFEVRLGDHDFDREGDGRKVQVPRENVLSDLEDELFAYNSNLL